MAVRDDLAHVVLAGGDRVRPQQQIAGPALLGVRGQLRRHEQREQDEQRDREADAVGAREDADQDAERGKEDGEQRPDDDPGRERVADEADAAADGVQQASADGQPGLLRVTLARPDSMNAAVAAVVGAGIPLLSFELEGARLSDAFLAMTESR